MTYLVCMDDTDMPGTRGTGWLAEELCQVLSQKDLVEASPISRHQLYVHEDIPYTSHNSAMCFELVLKQGTIDPVINFMAAFLEARAEKGSDPGLCVAAINNAMDAARLIEFGQAAKKTVLSKKIAYDLAQDLGIHLSEHGGTGQGVVGALAGIGLRLSGNDGRYRGWFHLGLPGDIVSVDTLCQYPFIDALITTAGVPLPMGDQIHIGSEKTKTVRKGNQQVVVVMANEDVKKTGIPFRTITKQEAKQY